MNFAPIVLFVYNRPKHTRQTIETLKQNLYAGQSDLIIYADGPKKCESDSAIREVRDYIKTISGFKNITITEHKQNLGLANSIIKGVTEVVHRYGKIIVLEDDLLISPDFLRFMNEALEYYSDEEKVMQISGHMFNVNIEAETEAVLLPFTTSWGWATWRRAWNHFDPQTHDYEIVKKNKALRYKFDLKGGYNYFDMLELQKKKEIDSWAIRWYLSVFMLEGLTLYPIKSLINNIGFDGSGTHCGDTSSGVNAISLNDINTEQIRFPKVTFDRNAYSQIIKHFNSQKSFKEKIKEICHKLRFFKNY